MVRSALLVGAVVAALVHVAAPAAAQDDARLMAADADPMELARAAARLGDAAVLARLDDGRARDVRLAAIRATPFLHAPERALATLAALAGGRDSLLAPAAALAALRIVRVLDGPSLDRRECAPSELHDARVAWERVTHDATARADIHHAAAEIAAALPALGVP